MKVTVYIVVIEDIFGVVGSVSLANLSPGNIKDGVVINGVTGDYPSSTYPLDSASATTPDLDYDTFNDKMKSSASFEYWTSEGVHHTNEGGTLNKESTKQIIIVYE